MILVLSLVAIVSLLALTRVCTRQKLSPPPLVMPLIAAVAIPLLMLIAGIVGLGGPAVLQKSLAATITLLWSFSLIRLLSWPLQIPSELLVETHRQNPAGPPHPGHHQQRGTGGDHRDFASTLLASLPHQPWPQPFSVLQPRKPSRTFSRDIPSGRLPRGGDWIDLPDKGVVTSPA